MAKKKAKKKTKRASPDTRTERALWERIKTLEARFELLKSQLNPLDAPLETLDHPTRTMIEEINQVM